MLRASFVFLFLINIPTFGKAYNVIVRNIHHRENKVVQTINIPSSKTTIVQGVGATCEIESVWYNNFTHVKATLKSDDGNVAAGMGQLKIDEYGSFIINLNDFDCIVQDK